MPYPSVPQMKNRVQWPHKRLLRAFDGAEKVSAVVLNRHQTERATLLRWGCVEIIKGERDPSHDVCLYRLTERGSALRAAIN